MTVAKNDISAAELREHLDYDSVTGIFRWKKKPAKPGIEVGDIAGGLNNRGYWVIRALGRTRTAHRLAWLWITGEWPADQIDHVNMIRHDNRFANLRECNRSANMANAKAHANNMSGIKGVSFYKPSGRWLAQIKKDGLKQHIGLFDSKEEAAFAYSAKALELFGNFARTE